MTKHIISVVIADDHPGYRAGVSGSLSASDRFKVIGEAENGKEALTMALGLRPDVLYLICPCRSWKVLMWPGP